MTETSGERELWDETDNAVSLEALCKALREGNWCLVIGERGVGKTRLADHIGQKWGSLCASVDVFRAHLTSNDNPNAFYSALAVQMARSARERGYLVPEPKPDEAAEGFEIWKAHIDSWVAESPNQARLLIIDSLSAQGGGPIRSFTSTLFALKQHLADYGGNVVVLILSRLSLSELDELNPRQASPQSAKLVERAYRLNPFSLTEVRQFLAQLHGVAVSHEAEAALWTWCEGYPDDLEAVASMPLQTVEQVWDAVLATAASRGPDPLGGAEASELLTSHSLDLESTAKLVASFRMGSQGGGDVATPTSLSPEQRRLSLKLKNAGLISSSRTRVRWRNHLAAEQVDRWLLKGRVGEALSKAGLRLDAPNALRTLVQVSSSVQSVVATAEHDVKEAKELARIVGRTAWRRTVTAGVGVGCLVAGPAVLYHQDALAKRERDVVEETRAAILKQSEPSKPEEVVAPGKEIAQVAEDRQKVATLQDRVRKAYADTLEKPGDQELGDEYRKVLDELGKAKAEAEKSARSLGVARRREAAAREQARAASVRQEAVEQLRTEGLQTIDALRAQLAAAAERQRTATETANEELAAAAERLQACGVAREDAKQEWGTCLAALQACQETLSSKTKQQQPPLPIQNPPAPESPIAAPE